MATILPPQKKTQKPRTVLVRSRSMVTCTFLFRIVVSLSCVLPSSFAGTHKNERKRHPFYPPPVKPLRPADCPSSCHEVFSKLGHGTDYGGVMRHSIDVQQRGGKVRAHPVKLPYSFTVFTCYSSLRSLCSVHDQSSFSYGWPHPASLGLSQKRPKP